MSMFGRESELAASCAEKSISVTVDPFRLSTGASRAVRALPVRVRQSASRGPGHKPRFAANTCSDAAASSASFSRFNRYRRSRW